MKRTLLIIFLVLVVAPFVILSLGFIVGILFTDDHKEVTFIAQDEIIADGKIQTIDVLVASKQIHADEPFTKDNTTVQAIPMDEVAYYFVTERNYSSFDAFYAMHLHAVIPFKTGEPIATKVPHLKVKKSENDGLTIVQREIPTFDVILAKQDIPAGTLLTRDLIEAQPYIRHKINQYIQLSFSPKHLDWFAEDENIACFSMKANTPILSTRVAKDCTQYLAQ